MRRALRRPGLRHAAAEPASATRFYPGWARRVMQQYEQHKGWIDRRARRLFPDTEPDLGALRRQGPPGIPHMPATRYSSAPNPAEAVSPGGYRSARWRLAAFNPQISLGARTNSSNHGNLKRYIWAN